MSGSGQQAAAAAGGRFRFEVDERGGVTVVVDGQPQSHVDPADPGLLAFDYVAHLALVLDALPAGPLRVTHIGGAGLTLARWVQHTRPGSPQVVLEPDAELTAAVRQRLPLPRDHRIRVRDVAGRAGLAALRDGSADVLVLDAYAAGRVPGDLTTVEAWREAARVVGPSGVLVANLADEPGLAYLARVLAGLVAGFAGAHPGSQGGPHEPAERPTGAGGRGTEAPAGREGGPPPGREGGPPPGREGRPPPGREGRPPPGRGVAAPARRDVALLAGRDVLKGRRFGNVVVASAPFGALDRARLRRAVSAAPLPTGLRLGAEVDRWRGGARPFTDADPHPSPEPPDPGRWRIR